MLEQYINTIERNFVPKEDFELEGFLLISYEKINTFFYKDYKELPILKRINEIKKTLINTLKQKKGSFIEEIDSEYDIKLDEARETMEDSPNRRRIITELIDTKDALMAKVKKHSKTIIKEYLSKFISVSPFEYYKQLLSDKALFHKLCCPYIDEAMAEQIRVDTLHNLNQNKIELEDLAPLMYMKYIIEGLEEKLTARHVVIDESQDFSVFQLFILKKVIGGNSFTILGDLCQGIHSYRGINDWKSAAESIFGEDNYSMLTLEQSYRTTIEIMEAANSVIKFLNDPKLPPSKPVIRHGDAVKVIEKLSLKEVARAIVDQISKLKEEGFKSAAIICKPLEECKRLKYI